MSANCRILFNVIIGEKRKLKVEIKSRNKAFIGIIWHL